MMRGCILEFMSGRSVRWIPRQITTQIPSFVSSRKEFSAAPHQNASPGSGSGSAGKPSESGSQVMKFFIGSVAVGAAVMAAYQTGYLSPLYTKEKTTTLESEKLDADNNVEQVPNNQETNRLSPDTEHFKEKSESNADIPHQNLNEREGDSQVQDAPEAIPVEDIIAAPEKDLPSVPQASMTSDDQSIQSETLKEDSHDTDSAHMKTSIEQNREVDGEPILTEIKSILEETQTTMPSPYHVISEDDVPEDTQNKDSKPPNSLLDTYLIQKDEENPKKSLDEVSALDNRSIPEAKEASVATSEDLKDAYLSKDGKLVLDFLQAIHAAEQRQAELDAHIFAEEKRILKEKYEKELKDARARELMFAEEAAILDKELNKERSKTIATIKSLQEKAEEILKIELQRKEDEAQLQLKKLQELAKAELAAAIASEKASQIEKMAETNLHINALCMAFYARSEEARQSHSAHKLALGALALEDALSNGLPIQNEMDALNTYLEGINGESLIDLVLSSLPEETLNYGTDTQLQLNQKFDAMKGALRHFSLVPPGGGGFLAHSLAHVASWLKMREDDQSGDGIESLINRVESFLAEGKLPEAADALERGVNGSQAEEIVVDWVRRVRNRAVMEQALSLLQSYATSISLT